jgi:C-terminal processing protease CtpA/Prc
VPDISREASPDEKLAELLAEQKRREKQRRPQSVPHTLENTTADTSESQWNKTGADTSLFDELEQSGGAVQQRRNTAELIDDDYTMFTVRLVKDPRYGLGLTLVDGEIQGVQGVYVKSLTPGGPAELQAQLRCGMCTPLPHLSLFYSNPHPGDKLVAINDTPLHGKNRHEAVKIVQQSEAAVEMKLLRLKSLTSGTTHEHALIETHERSNLASKTPPPAKKTPASVTQQRQPRYRAKTDVMPGSASMDAPPFESSSILTEVS